MTWFQILNLPLNSYDLGQVILTSQLSSGVTREYYLLHSLVVFRNEATSVKAPGGVERAGGGEERKERRERRGRLQQRGSPISRNSEQNFPSRAGRRRAAVRMHLRTRRKEIDRT